MDKAALNLKKKQQVCTDTILRDFNYKISMPLDQSHVEKTGNVVFNHQQAPPDERDAIQKDVRQTMVEFTFDLQKDVHANDQDPEKQAITDDSYKVNFTKVQLQNFFEELEKVQLQVDQLNA